MKFELADLKTPDALNEYCRRTFGQPMNPAGAPWATPSSAEAS